MWDSLEMEIQSKENVFAFKKEIARMYKCSFFDITCTMEYWNVCIYSSILLLYHYYGFVYNYYINTSQLCQEDRGPTPMMI